MSSKMKFQSDMCAASSKAGGSHLTRQARRGFINIFVSMMYALGFPVIAIDQVGLRAIEAFVAARKGLGRTLRTMQNDMSSLRTILRSAGRHQFARDPNISNRALGLSGASRKGTKRAATDEEFLDLLTRTQHPGLRAILTLERWMGLRAEEAIQSVWSLNTWLRALRSGSTDLHVIFGTKNGKPRQTHIFNRAAVLAAVELALRVVAASGRLAPKGNLKAAKKWYSNAMNRIGFCGHSLRYRFCQDAIEAYIAAGFSEKEARALTSMDLGHGDNRGRMIALVYGQNGTPCAENARGR